MLSPTVLSCLKNLSLNMFQYSSISEIFKISCICEKKKLFYESSNLAPAAASLEQEKADMEQAWLCAKRRKPVSCYLVSSATLLWIFLTFWDPADLLQATAWHADKDGQLGNSRWCTIPLQAAVAAEAHDVDMAAQQDLWGERGWQSLHAFQGFLVLPVLALSWELAVFKASILDKFHLGEAQFLHSQVTAQSTLKCTSQWVSGNDQQICFKSTLVIRTKCWQMHLWWDRFNLHHSFQLCPTPQTPWCNTKK